MRFLFCTTGANQALIKDFDITPTVCAKEGEVVCAVGGVITGAITGGKVLGVCAEDHSGTKELLNERANGSKLRVNATNGAVYGAKANVFSASSAGSATTFICSGTGISTAAAGGILVLSKKAEGSTNSDNVGTARTISSVSVSSGTATFTISSGGKPCVGDEYTFYPALGAEMCLDNGKTGIVCTNSSTDVKFKVVGKDTDKGEVQVTIKNLLLA